MIEKYHELIGYTDSDPLAVDQESLELAGLYISRKILPNKFRQDAVHIAIATVFSVDLLVSWNFRHIVHFNKIWRFNAVNKEMGYKQLEIRSPMEVCSNEEE